MSKIELMASDIESLATEQEIPVPPPSIPEPMLEAYQEMETTEPRKSNGRGRSQEKLPTKLPIPRIAKFLPDAEHVKIFKVELGHRRYIKTYSARDLARAPDIEVFIQSHVMPTAGEGDYDVDVINAKGELARTVPVSVIDPNKLPAGFTAQNMSDNKVIEKLLDRIDRLEHESTPVKTFAEQVQEIAQVKSMFGGDDKKSPDAMMLFMMMQQQQQHSTAPSKELAELRAELRDLARMQENQYRNQALPMPLPMPASTPDTSIADVVRAVAEIGAKKDETTLRDLIPLLKPEKSIGLPEILGIVGAISPMLEKIFGGNKNHEMEMMTLRNDIRDLRQAPSKTIKDTIDDVGAIVGLARNLTGGSSGDGDNFWSFANKLIDHGAEVVGSIGDMMTKIREEQAASPMISSGGNKEEGGRDDSDEDSDEDGLDLPDGFDSYVKAIEDATDDAGKIGATLIAFQFLGKTPEWRKFLAPIIVYARQGKKREALEFLTNFLRALQERDMLTEHTVNLTIKAFEENYEKVAEVLSKKADKKE